jgi:hypothetical protein
LGSTCFFDAEGGREEEAEEEEVSVVLSPL